MKRSVREWISRRYSVPEHFAHGRSVVAVLLAASLAGCASAPRGGVATSIAPDSLVRDAGSSDPWWQAFGSPALDTLIAEALRASPSVAAAEATLRQSEELVAARAGMNRYPQADAILGAQQQRVNPAMFGQPGTPREFGLQSATVSVRYRLDLTGGNRRALEALAARSDHQRFQLAGARLTLSAMIATAAVQQAQLSAQLDATQEILRQQEEDLTISGERVRLGAASPDEVLTHRSRVAQTRADLLAQQSLGQQNAHLLAVLAGREPGATLPPRFTLSDLKLPADLPAVVPSEVLRGRPDILAAEALMRAADAEHGVAVARLYPQLDLSASLGTQALTSGVLFGSGSAVWTLLAQLTQPLFNPGLRAEKRASLAAFDAAASHYQGVVLESLRNTADLLVALDHDARVLEELTSADEAARAALTSVQRQYALGSVGYREVLAAGQQAQQVRVALVSARAKQLLDAVALHQAVGGTTATPRDDEPTPKEEPR
ncbi:MAG TPA: RND transporter [Gemmatimonas aurantiaca]|uniref:RND transporter n=1 Tax=Gemmatimonas aurantiaca TaxID=173480 RepID=A0A3D4V6H7_9BACT|nr:RND transporter [Gemmatimonas aurantiaca]